MQAGGEILPMQELLKEYASLCKDQGLIAQFSIYPDKAEIMLSDSPDWLLFNERQLLVFMKGLMAGARIIRNNNKVDLSSPQGVSSLANTSSSS